MMKMDYIIETESLTKKYGKTVVVEDVSLHVKRGEIYGLIGKNGAGKTTFLKMVSKLVNATSGKIIMRPLDNKKLKIGCLIEDPGLYYEMNAFENLKCKCIMSGINNKEYIESLLRLVFLEKAGKKKVCDFSLGMKQRLGIAIALVGKTDILILDEPINGLDPQGILEIRTLLKRLKDEEKISIMISSHILSELDKLADTVGIIHKGKLLKEISDEEIEKESYIEIETPDSNAVNRLLTEKKILNTSIIDEKTIRIYDCNDDIMKINEYIVTEGCGLIQSKRIKSDLESYYINLVGMDGV